MGAGTRSALANIGQGNRLADTISNSGEEFAAATTKNANLTGDTLGALSSFIANDEKNRSRYPDEKVEEV